MNSLNLIEIKEEISAVAELLYQENTDEGYPRLIAVLNIVSEYMESITDREKQMKLITAVKAAVSAMEAEDVTLLADILCFELLPIL